MSATFSESFLVNSFEVDPLGEMRVAALVRRLQNAADGHARQHQLAVDQLLSTARTWVLREFHLRVLRTPHFLEPCRVHTWASHRSAGIRAWRDFVLETEAGERLAVATSLWLMLDVQRWKLTRLPAEVFAMVNAEEPAALEPLEICSDFAAPDITDEVRVHWLDVDLNGHVNNVRYLNWMLAAVPDSQWQMNRISELALDFQDEARSGDRLYPSTQADGDGASLLRIGNGNGKLLVLGRAMWVPRHPVQKHDSLIYETNP